MCQRCERRFTNEQDGSRRARRGRRARRRRRRLLVRPAARRRYRRGQRQRRVAQAPGKGGPAGGGRRSPSRRSRRRLQPMPQTITAVGSLRSDESITVRPEVAGRVSAIGFEEGQRVAKGAHADPARSRDQRGGSAAGDGEPEARAEQVRPRGRPREKQLHFGPGEGRGGEQPARRRGRRRARRGAARQDGDQARRFPGSSAFARCRSATTSRKATTWSTSSRSIR